MHTILHIITHNSYINSVQYTYKFPEVEGDGSGCVYMLVLHHASLVEVLHHTSLVTEVVFQVVVLEVVLHHTSLVTEMVVCWRLWSYITLLWRRCYITLLWGRYWCCVEASYIISPSCGSSESEVEISFFFFGFFSFMRLFTFFHFRTLRITGAGISRPSFSSVSTFYVFPLQNSQNHWSWNSRPSFYSVS